MDILQGFRNKVANSIDEKGVYPTPTIILLNDDKIEYFAMAVEAPVIIKIAFKNCQRAEVKEQLVALDTYTKPGQGTTLDSCLILFHLKRGQPTRIGVLEYTYNNGHPVTRDVVWDNAFWNRQYCRLADAFTESFNYLQ